MFAEKACAACKQQFQPRSPNAKRCVTCRRLKWVADVAALPAPSREYRESYGRTCAHCQVEFKSWNRAARYCGESCRTKAEHARKVKDADWLNTPLKCGICSTEFLRTLETGPNKKYCSPECTMRARRRDHLRFKELYPGAMDAYNRKRTKKHGKDTLIARLRKRYPDLPTVCETPGCGEGRVLEIAHRPEHKRNGAWRTMDRYERHMFWMLCPTCHAVLDLGIETPEQMDLRKLAPAEE